MYTLSLWVESFLKEININSFFWQQKKVISMKTFATESNINKNTLKN